MLMYKRAAETPVEEELTQAVRRVVHQYGSDLTAYFRHVEEVAKKGTQESNPVVDSVRENRDAESDS